VAVRLFIPCVEGTAGPWTGRFITGTITASRVAAVRGPAERGLRAVLRFCREYPPRVAWRDRALAWRTLILLGVIGVGASLHFAWYGAVDDAGCYDGDLSAWDLAWPSHAGYEHTGRLPVTVLIIGAGIAWPTPLRLALDLPELIGHGGGWRVLPGQSVSLTRSPTSLSLFLTIPVNAARSTPVSGSGLEQPYASPQELPD